MAELNNHNNSIPEIDNTGCCLDSANNRIICNCSKTDSGNITGIYTDPITGESIKACYNTSRGAWFYGYEEIRKHNLVAFNELSAEKRKAISNMGVTASKQKREEKKNFNELAKAMLEQTLTESQVTEILGTATNMLLDNSVASVMLGKMIQGAMEGSFKCAEFVRDSAGYKPKNEVQLEADIMTDADRELIANLQKRIG